jgi:hypothetical protein
MGALASHGSYMHQLRIMHRPRGPKWTHYRSLRLRIVTKRLNFEDSTEKAPVTSGSPLVTAPPSSPHPPFPRGKQNVRNTTIFCRKPVTYLHYCRLQSQD